MECKTSNFSLFDQQAMQTDILSSSIVDYHPRTAENAGPIEFVIPGGSDDYIDLRFRIQQADGTAIDDTHKVGLNNLPLTTLRPS